MSTSQPKTIQEHIEIIDFRCENLKKLKPGDYIFYCQKCATFFNEKPGKQNVSCYFCELIETSI